MALKESINKQPITCTKWGMLVTVECARGRPRVHSCKMCSARICTHGKHVQSLFHECSCDHSFALEFYQYFISLPMKCQSKPSSEPQHFGALHTNRCPRTSPKYHLSAHTSFRNFGAHFDTDTNCRFNWHKQSVFVHWYLDQAWVCRKPAFGLLNWGQNQRCPPSIGQWIPVLPWERHSGQWYCFPERWCCPK